MAYTIDHLSPFEINLFYFSFLRIVLPYLSRTAYICIHSLLLSVSSTLSEEQCSNLCCDTTFTTYLLNSGLFHRLRLCPTFRTYLYSYLHINNLTHIYTSYLNPHIPRIISIIFLKDFLPIFPRSIMIILSQSLICHPIPTFVTFFFALCQSPHHQPTNFFLTFLSSTLKVTYPTPHISSHLVLVLVLLSSEHPSPPYYYCIQPIRHSFFIMLCTQLTPILHTTLF